MHVNGKKEEENEESFLIKKIKKITETEHKHNLNLMAEHLTPTPPPPQ